MDRNIFTCLVIFLFVTISRGEEDLFLSNQLCLQYLDSSGRQYINAGECVISCNIVSGQKLCSMNDPGCNAFAAFINQSPQVQSGNFYCNVLIPSQSFQNNFDYSGKISNQIPSQNVISESLPSFNNYAPNVIQNNIDTFNPNTLTGLFNARVPKTQRSTDQFCAQYVNNKRISQRVGECVVKCWPNYYTPTLPKVCGTSDAFCRPFLSFIFDSSQAPQDAYFRCNILPQPTKFYPTNSLADERNLCTGYKNLLPNSSKVSRCKLTCGYVYVYVTVLLSVNEQERIMCEVDSNFAGCEGFKEYAEYRAKGPGTITCDIYNHGQSYNYKKVQYLTNLISNRVVGTRGLLG